jgi:NADPH:quinone reductase-like Zn-dependent oxidoreductase
MKAAQINAYGGKDALKTVSDAPKPKLEADQVLVEVRAAAVNPFDWKVREGYMKDSVALPLPATLGGDLAGVVAELGEGVAGFAVGDDVYGQADALSGQGSYAEFAPVKAESLAAKPTSVAFVTAAALPLAGVSAYQALVEHIGLRNGQKILIHGGAGGIGSHAIQLAKYLGARVATTAAPDEAEFVKDLGADEIIDYTSSKFEEILQDYDAVYDTVGGDTYARSFQILKPGGIIVSMLEKQHEQLSKQRNVTAISQFTRVTTERLERLADLVDRGALKAHIDKTFPLEEAAEALEYIHQGRHHGKVVLKVK